MDPIGAASTETESGDASGPVTVAGRPVGERGRRDPSEGLCYSAERSRPPGPGPDAKAGVPDNPASGGPAVPSRGACLPQTTRMTQPSSFEKILGQPLDQFVRLPQDQRAGALRAAIPDLNFFFDQGRSFEQRDAPARTRELARSLFEALAPEPQREGGRGAESALAERIVTDALPALARPTATRTSTWAGSSRAR